MIAIYARVSTEEQAKSGYSLRDQIRACQEKAGTDKTAEYIDEGISGEFLDRPSLTKLRNDVRKGVITKVICLDPDRLSRKLMNQLLLSEEIEKRAVLEFVNGEYQHTPEGKLFYQMRGAISEFEKAKITERFSRGRREKARQGRIVRDYLVYGYDYLKEKDQFVINEFEAEVVRLIFNLFTGKLANVKGINGIAIYLNDQLIPTKRGAAVWHRQVVRQILMNRAYIGEFYQNRWNTEGMLGNKFKIKEEKIPVRKRPESEWIMVPCPSIIDREQFEYAQKLLEVSRQRWAGVSKHKYLLSGLVRCGYCGNTMTGRKAKHWGKTLYEYTDVKNTAGAKTKGCGHKIKAEILEELVWDKVLNYLRQPECIELLIDNLKAISTDSYEQSELKRLERLLAIKKQGLRDFMKLMLNGKLADADANEVNELVVQSQLEIEKIIKQINETEEMLQKTQNEQFNFKEGLEYYLFESSGELVFDDKQELIHLIVRQIEVYKNEIRIFGF